MKNCYETYPFFGSNIKVMRPGGLTLTDEMIEECNLKTSAKILDVGCGVGTVVGYLKSRYGYDAIGIDCSEKIIKEGLLSVPELPIRVAKAEALPYENGVMDCILMECTLSVFQHPKSVLEEAYRVMKEGAKLAISDVYLKDSSKDSLKDSSCTSSIKEICEIEEMLKAQGFKVIKWSEKTPALHSYVAEMIWNQSSDKDDDFLSGFCSCGGVSGLKLGYFSLIAEK